MEYTEDYINTCFTVWFSAGQPVNLNLLLDKIPPSENGNKPSKDTLYRFRGEHGWDERADVLNADAVQKSNLALVDMKATMLMEQANRARLLADKSHKFLMDNDFDSSSSALKAYFSATEEERKVRNVGEMLIKISQMSPEELEAKAMKLLRRKNEAVEGEVIDESVDQESNGEEK